MEVKGIAVKSLKEYVETHFPDGYSSWFDSLPEESKLIFSDAIISTEWYNAKYGISVPTGNLAMFCNGDAEKAAFKAGYEGATDALTGVYKFFVQISSPFFIINRANVIFKNYYQPSEMISEKLSKTKVKVIISKFDETDIVIEGRIMGWIQRALELSGCKNVVVSRIASVTEGNPVTELILTWD